MFQLQLYEEQLQVHPPPPPHTHTQLLLSDDLVVIEALAKVCKDHHTELASTLIQIFCEYDRVVPILPACIAKSIDKEGMCVSMSGGTSILYS